MMGSMVTESDREGWVRVRRPMGIKGGGSEVSGERVRCQVKMGRGGGEVTREVLSENGAGRGGRCRVRCQVKMGPGVGARCNPGGWYTRSWS